MLHACGLYWRIAVNFAIRKVSTLTWQRQRLIRATIVFRGRTGLGIVYSAAGVESDM